MHPSLSLFPLSLSYQRVLGLSSSSHGQRWQCSSWASHLPRATTNPSSLSVCCSMCDGVPFSLLSVTQASQPQIICKKKSNKQKNTVCVCVFVGKKMNKRWDKMKSWRSIVLGRKREDLCDWEYQWRLRNLMLRDVPWCLKRALYLFLISLEWKAAAMDEWERERERERGSMEFYSKGFQPRVSSCSPSGPHSLSMQPSGSTSIPTLAICYTISYTIYYRK